MKKDEETQEIWFWMNKKWLLCWSQRAGGYAPTSFASILYGDLKFLEIDIYVDEKAGEAIFRRPPRL